MKAREYFESRNVIKANPLLGTLRSGRLMGLFGMACMASLLLFSVLIDVLFNGGRHYANGSNMYTYVLLTVCFIPLLVNNALGERYWKRIEQRRFAAVRGNRLFLAAEQPTPDTALLPMPMTIKLRPKKVRFLLIIGMALLIAIFLAGMFTWFDSDPLLLVPNHLLNFLALLAIGFVPAFIIFFAILLSPLVREQIEATEGGLASSNGKKVTTVPWNEARLFAMYNALGAQKSGAAITYELSSARDIVRWTWYQRWTWIQGMEPVIPHDEYNRQMHGLLSLVAAKTGLPLYDLREDLPKGEPKD